MHGHDPLGISLLQSIVAEEEKQVKFHSADAPMQTFIDTLVLLQVRILFGIIDTYSSAGISYN